MTNERSVYAMRLQLVARVRARFSPRKALYTAPALRTELLSVRKRSFYGWSFFPNMFLNISVTTRASKNEIIKIGDNTFKVYVTAVPEKGLANKKIIELLSDYLKVSKSLIKIK